MNKIVSHIILYLLFLIGCVSTNVVQPERLEADTTKDIVIFTQDGRTIRMFSGDYQVVRICEVKNIRCKGKLFLNDQRTEMKPFEGEVAFNQIKFIETIHKSIFYYTGPILFGAATLFIIFIAIVLQGRGFGG